MFSRRKAWNSLLASLGRRDKGREREGYGAEDEVVDAFAEGEEGGICCCCSGGGGRGGGEFGEDAVEGCCEAAEEGVEEPLGVGWLGCRV